MQRHTAVVNVKRKDILLLGYGSPQLMVPRSATRDPALFGMMYGHIILRKYMF